MTPSNDGTTHINVYSKGRTDLGRWLSNFAHSPFVHPAHGAFASVEGFWHWLSCGQSGLRNLYGIMAKKEGKKWPRIYTLSEEEFQRNIREACWQKLWGNPSMACNLANSTLPFTHYYVFGGLVKDAGHKWLLTMWEQFRVEIRRHIRQ